MQVSLSPKLFECFLFNFFFSCKNACFTKISPELKQSILTQFNGLANKNIQDSHLAGLISMNHISRRRPRRNEHNKTHGASFTYKIRHPEYQSQVCKTAFLSLHGIKDGRVRRIRDSLMITGASPRDKRGSHKNRPKKISESVTDLIKMHIKSFPSRQSHYSRRKNPDCYYLPESLTLKDMHSIFLEKYRINISYKSYWRIFRTHFNIKFGFPRSDTCSECDRIAQQLNNLELNAEERTKLNVEKELHLRKAEAFFELKRQYKIKAKAGEVMCISFDFMQNLPLPHIPSNPVFYSRQLWYNVFGIHDLGNDEAFMYTYLETEAKKGSNEVTSMLLHYLKNNIHNRSLVIFSDGCPGQNKNYVMLHFLYSLVHVLKIVDSVEYVFPMRGHSYLPNDSDFALIEKKKRRLERAERPEDWDKIILNARTKPTPFHLVKMRQDDFFDIKSATASFFLKSPKPAITIKKIRIMKISTATRTLLLKDGYSGPFRTSIIARANLPSTIQLGKLHDSPIPIASNKAENLRSLLPLLRLVENKQYYEHVLDGTVFVNAAGAEIEEDDNSSGCEY